MATVSDLVRRTRDFLSDRPGVNVLNGSMDSSTTTATLEYPFISPLAPGSTVEVDGESMFVLAVNGNTLTVYRGHDGSTAAAHDDAALVLVDPPHPERQVIDRLLEEVRSWPHTLHGTSKFTIDYTEDERAVDFDASAYSAVLEVRIPREDATSTEDDDLVPIPFYVNWDAPTALFASGGSITVAPIHYDTTLYVTALAPFTTTTFTRTTDLDTIGLTASMYDIPCLGAAARLLFADEASRNQAWAQNQSREVEEVPAGSILRTAAMYRGLADQRVQEEALKQLPKRGGLRVRP